MGMPFGSMFDQHSSTVGRRTVPSAQRTYPPVGPVPVPEVVTGTGDWQGAATPPDPPAPALPPVDTPPVDAPPLDAPPLDAPATAPVECSAPPVDPASSPPARLTTFPLQADSDPNPMAVRRVT
jgi:hypothetical protein